ncbi:hypothetical protein APHAL10511_001597 [Amanita phalloides]|nr:hypothetical protein APHAL10511_001597 [Amanita phalloides]
MQDTLEESGPSYVAAQSADIILSDVRPIRLKSEALKAINVFLDEFLFNILQNANSLSTDRLRSSLLGLLPTCLGKEALLEAEVELRAYYERMGTGAVSLADDTKTFNLHYAFQLLRLKCSAYSTLNDSDEDPNAEAHILEQMRNTDEVPFTPNRIAPAALYLTAIVEALCEYVDNLFLYKTAQLIGETHRHILGDVAKVTARDSSRTDATIQDLYTALCEDESIYGTFKPMKVFEHVVGQLSNKSFARAEKHSVSRSHHDSTATTTTLASTSDLSYTRLSSETQGGTTGTTPGARSSTDKSRVMKKFINNRSSHEREEPQGIQAQESVSQANGISLRRSVSAHDEDSERKISLEDAATLQEFDDLVRSTSTMKVSLTPDRLRTMETYKQEKAQKAMQVDGPDSDKTNASSVSRRPSIRQVESILEDEEEGNAFPKLPPTSRQRQGSVTSSSNTSLVSSSGNRNRSFSMSSPGSRAFGKKLLRNPPPFSPSHMFHSPSLSSMRAPNPTASRQLGGTEFNPLPPRTRKIQRNRESVDLDDIMNGSEDDNLSSLSVKQHKPPIAPRTTRPARGISSNTRDLIDFLSEGPPEATNFDIRTASPRISTPDPGRKTPGRLQRMISKLSLGGSDKREEGPRTPTTMSPPPLPSLPPSLRSFAISPIPSLSTRPSVASLSPLANKPIPPRYPRPPSPPPSSPSQSSSEEPVVTRVKKSVGQDSLEAKSPDLPLSQYRQNRVASPVTHKREEREFTSNHVGHDGVGHGHPKTADQERMSNRVNHQVPRSPASLEKVHLITPAPSSQVSPVHDPVSLPPQSLTRSPSFRKPLAPITSPISPVSSPIEASHPAVHATPSGVLADTDVRNMHRLMSQAGSADECRLILDMFLARAGVKVARATTPIMALPSKSQTLLDSPLESAVVELFLGGEAPSDGLGSPRKLRFKRHKTGPLRPHTVDGS